MSGEGGITAALSAETNKTWRLYPSQVTLFLRRHLQQHPSRHTLAQTRRLVPPINTDPTLLSWTQKESLASPSLHQALLCMSCNLQTSQRSPDYNEEGASRWRGQREGHVEGEWVAAQED